MKTFTIVAAALLAATFGSAARADSEWVMIDRPPPVTGADGLPHEATCSAYPRTDPSYRFWVRPGNPKKLAVIFDGGGACWDNLTCSFPEGGGMRDPVLQFYTPAIPPDGDPSRYGGLVDLTNPDNPVLDWTLVAIPYCTGDVHLGSIDRAYSTVGHPTLPRKMTIRHRGYDNFMVVLDWISKNVPQGVESLLVTGASAGGYGAAAHFPWLARQYPRARLTVLADASQGVTTPKWETGTPGRGSWNIQLAPWVFGQNPDDTLAADLLLRGAQAYPEARFAQSTTTEDSVQVGFYAAMRLLYGPPAPGSCKRLVPDWNRQMLAKLGEYGATLPNFHSFVLGGTKHTIIGDSDFYADTPAGWRFSDWLQAMLDRNPSWVDAACPDCLTPLPCP